MLLNVLQKHIFNVGKWGLRQLKIRYFGYRRKLSDHYLSGPEVPEKKIWKCDVHKIFSATGKSVLPLTPNECVDDSILNASATFVDLHKGFANYHGKLQKQVGDEFSST